MKRINLSSRLSGRLGAAISSAILQGMTIVALFCFKLQYSDESFSSLIELVAWASVIGAGATFRLEILLLQLRNVVDKASLLVTFVFAICFVVCACALLKALDAGVGLSTPPSLNLFVLSLGYGLIEAQTFLSVRLNWSHILLVNRIAQALGILLAVGLGFLRVDFAVIVSVFCLSITLPSLLWGVYALHKSPGKMELFFPGLKIFVRGLSLTVATSVNTLYASLAILIAAQTQSASFVADFGFIQKLLAGPITFIRHFYAHAYLSNLLEVMKDSPDKTDQAWHLTLRAYVTSMATYLPFAIITGFVSYVYPQVFGLSHPELVLYVALVTLFQAGVSTIAGVRTPLHLEHQFLMFDIGRLMILAVALVLPIGISFEVKFGVVSSLLYLNYIFFVRRQLSLRRD